MEENNSSLLTGGSKEKSSAPQLVRYIVFLLLILVVVVGGYKGYIYYLEQKLERQQRDAWKEVEALFAQESIPVAPEGVDPLNYGLEDAFNRDARPEGRIIVSGSKRNTSEITQALSISPWTGFTDAVPLIPSLKTSALVEFLNVYEPSDFFISTLSEASAATEVDGFGIHKVDTRQGVLEYLPSTAGAHVRHMAWSSASGLLAFSRLSNMQSEVADVDSLPVSNWEVAVVNPSNGEVIVRIQSAVQAKWSPDGTMLLILKADGLYAYTIETKEEVKLIDAQEGRQFLSNSVFDVSVDGTHLVWAIPGSGLIVMNEITSWDPVTINEIGRISVPDTEFYWPQFSPDGAYYVVQAISVPQTEGAIRFDPRLEIRPTRNREVITSHSLSDYNFDAFFTDAWIEESVGTLSQ